MWSRDPGPFSSSASRNITSSRRTSNWHRAAWFCARNAGVVNGVFNSFVKQGYQFCVAERYPFLSVVVPRD